MLRHNFLLAFRNFRRFKSTFIINLIGLSSGLACTLIIYLWAKDELEKDNFFQNDNQLFQVMENRVQAHGIWTAQSTSGVMADLMMKEFPEVQYAAHTSWVSESTLSVGASDVRAKGHYTGVEYFNIFSYEILQGDRRKLLTDKNSIVITEDLAMRFKDMIGAHNFNWGSTGPFCYLLLQPGTDVDAFNKKIADYVRVKTNNEVTHRTPFIRSYSKAYLYGKYENGVVVGGRITYVKMFSLIAIVILIIACINFMNLSTARASRRMKEVGIKKAVGAQRKTLIVQYLAESITLTFSSLIIAIILVQLSLSQFNAITDKHLSLTPSLEIIGAFLGIALFTGIVSGSYPSLYLSHFNPAAILKGKVQGKFGEIWARQGLVVFQFSLSVILIVSVLVIYKQLDLLQSKNLGYNKHNVIYFGMEGKTQDSRQTFLSELRNIPGIVNASTIAHDMTGHNSGTYGVVWEGKNMDDKTEFENVAVDYDMIETLGVEVSAGRSFSRDFGSDSTAIIFNEAGIKFMGMTDPLGKTVKLWGEDRKIIGVVKDFHFESLHKNVGPLFFRLEPNNTYLYMARIEAGKEKETIERIRSFYQKFNPEFTFDFNFLDEEYRLQYAAEQRVSVLSRYFAGLAVVISCLGLLGLAAFSAERRLKEIGIRKALGASVIGILYLLTSDFTKIVLVAILVALPLSYLIVSNWLEGFAFRIPLGPLYFVGAGTIALLIAILTVSAQTFKAANVNPSECLRNE
jgi:putative ABC transport system permease protein